MRILSVLLDSKLEQFKVKSLQTFQSSKELIDRVKHDFA